MIRRSNVHACQICYWQQEALLLGGIYIPFMHTLCAPGAYASFRDGERKAFFAKKAVQCKRHSGRVLPDELLR